jgi:predicted dehydrogenase
MVRIGLAGLGFMGRTHLGAYQRIAGAEVVAVCDPRRDALCGSRVNADSIFPTLYGTLDLGRVAVYSSLQDMLTAGGFDVVDICAPTHLHADFAVSALQAGFHVFCEKPMALTVADTTRMLDTARESGKFLVVGQVLRYWPGYREVKALLDSGRYGRVRSAELSRLAGVPWWSAADWMRDSRLSGNAAVDLHIHDVDMVIFLFGAPRGVQSHGVLENDGSISQIMTFYDFPHAMVQANGGWIRSRTFDLRMRAFFILESASIELVSRGKTVVTVYPETDEPFPLPLTEEDGFVAELRDFVEGVEKGRLSELNPPQAAADGVALCLLEIESAKERVAKTFAPIGRRRIQRSP